MAEQKARKLRRSETLPKTPPRRSGSPLPTQKSQEIAHLMEVTPTPRTKRAAPDELEPAPAVTPVRKMHISTDVEDAASSSITPVREKQPSTHALNSSSDFLTPELQAMRAVSRRAAAEAAETTGKLVLKKNILPDNGEESGMTATA